MGSLCSCFHVPDVQDNIGWNNSNSNNCFCPKCFFQKLKNKHGNIFRRGQTRANQQASSSNSRLVSNNSSHASGPHDGASGNMARQQNGARGRQERGTRCLRVQPEPAGQSDVQVNTKSVQGNRPLVSKEQNSESPEKVLSSGIDSEDVEDACPTCLEEYTKDNPRIETKCSHHYHLSCIYEWMERSVNCPMCGKLMQFDEAS